ncbi:hypothetical protein HY065_00505 [Candidatus Berkelbacteria bacterium]|nr:hypothetical protein [Candidatus Berkelbacteria bacterium]
MPHYSQIHHNILEKGERARVGRQLLAIARDYLSLKPGGVCLFGGRNRWTLMEAQYHVPLLSWFPPIIAQLILSIIRPGTTYVGRYRGYFSLHSLCKHFEIIDYTPKILADPERFGFKKLSQMRSLTKIGAMCYSLIAPVVPNYLWMLKKS